MVVEDHGQDRNHRDSSFFGSMCGGVGQTRFKESVIRCLPSAAQPFEWAKSCALFDQCLNTNFAKFCGRGLISQGQTILSWLRSGEAGRSPQREGVTSGFLKQARSCLAFFTRVEDDKKISTSASRQWMC